MAGAYHCCLHSRHQAAAPELPGQAWFAAPLMLT